MLRRDGDGELVHRDRRTRLKVHHGTVTELGAIIRSVRFAEMPGHLGLAVPDEPMMSITVTWNEEMRTVVCHDFSNPVQSVNDQKQMAAFLRLFRRIRQLLDGLGLSDDPDWYKVPE